MGCKLISVKFHDRDPHKSLETELENLAAKSDKLTIAVGWFSRPGAEFLEQFLKNHSSLEIELIIGNLLGNVCSVFDRLLYLYSSRLSIKIAHGHRHSVKTSKFAPMMHSKIYYGENGINAGAIVGSTNLTGAAIGGSNSEADIILSGPHSDSVFVDIKQHLVNVAHDAEDYDPSKKWFYHYMARHRQNNFWENSEISNASFINSFDFDIKPEGTDGEFFLSMRRFIPDFKTLNGNAKITMSVKRFPAQSSTATALSPFTVTSSSLKFDTRARGRYANIKIENDASSESWRFGTINLDLRPDGRR